jgi:hypothetical protein
VIGCVVAALWPFKFALPMSWNAAVPGERVGLVFPAPGIARGKEPPPSMAEAMRHGWLEVRVEARPFTLDQWGPARILSLSWDVYHRNLTLGQDGDVLVLRLRTPATTDDGMPELRVAGVFAPDRSTLVRVSITPGKLELDIAPTTRIERSLPAAPLSVWNPGYPILLGNERSGDRPWRGVIRHAVIETAAGRIDYAEASAHVRPWILWHLHNGHRLNPLHGTSPFDAALNLVGFLPLGFAFGFGRRPSRAVWTVAFAAGASAVLEAAQFFVPGRVPSTTDLLLNTLGAACGWALARSAAPANATTPSNLQTPADESVTPVTRTQ